MNTMVEKVLKAVETNTEAAALEVEKELMELEVPEAHKILKTIKVNDPDKYIRLVELLPTKNLFLKIVQYNDGNEIDVEKVEPYEFTR